MNRCAPLLPVPSDRLSSSPLRTASPPQKPPWFHRENTAKTPQNHRAAKRGEIFNKSFNCSRSTVKHVLGGLRCFCGENTVKCANSHGEIAVRRALFSRRCVPVTGILPWRDPHSPLPDAPRCTPAPDVELGVDSQECAIPESSDATVFDENLNPSLRNRHAGLFGQHLFSP
jgi:hypothetical protein